MDHLDAQRRALPKTIHHQLHHLALAMVGRRHMRKDEKLHGTPGATASWTGTEEAKSIASIGSQSDP
jgi:hypothetical protein